MRIRMKIPTKKHMVMCAIAVLIVAGLLLVTFWKKDKPLVYDIVVLGDSIVGNPVDGGAPWPELLEKKLGVPVLNGGLGGTSMSLRSEHMWSSMANTEWSMVKLAEAIAYDDWKSQKATMAYAQSYSEVNNQALDYFEETMERLSNVDFSQVKLLVIEHGSNDYNAGIAVDNPDDKYDVSTFGGALRKTLTLLQEKYPDMRILIVSPIYCALGENNTKKCYDTKYGNGGFLQEYVSLEKEIAAEFEVEWLDAYHESGIWEENASEYMMDNLHPNAKGQELLSDYLAEYLHDNL